MKNLRSKSFGKLVGKFRQRAASLKGDHSTVLALGSPTPNAPPINIHVWGSPSTIDGVKLNYFDFVPPLDVDIAYTSDLYLDVDENGHAYHLPRQLSKNATSTILDDEEVVSDTLDHNWRRWKMNDWSISQQVEGFTAADHKLLEEVKENAALFQDTLGSVERSALYVTRDNLSEWLVVASRAPTLKHEDVLEGIDLAYWSSVLPLCGGSWVFGDVISNGKGQSVLIVGPPQSGKTTLALHLLAKNEEWTLSSSDSFVLHNNGGRKIDGTTNLFVAGSLRPPRVNIGTVVGTLHPNPFLDQLVSLPIASEAVKNGDEVLWQLKNEVEVNIAETFGPRRRNVFSEVVGVVQLGWDTKFFGGKAMARDIDASEVQFNQRQHPLLFDVHRADDSGELPQQLLATSRVPLVEVGGSVRFDSAARLVQSLFK